MQELDIQCLGLVGTYKDFISWLRTNGQTFTKPVTFLWLGNSMANLSFTGAATTLQCLIDELPSRIRGFTKVILGLDACNDGKEINDSYTSKPTEAWALNALNHANSLVDSQIFKLDEWEYQGEYDASSKCFTASVVARRDVELWLSGSMRYFPAGCRLKLAHSYKWNYDDLQSLLAMTSLKITNCWSHRTAYCERFLLFASSFHNTMLTEKIAILSKSQLKIHSINTPEACSPRCWFCRVLDLESHSCHTQHGGSPLQGCSWPWKCHFDF